MIACLCCARRPLVQGPSFLADVSVVVLWVVCVVAEIEAASPLVAGPLDGPAGAPVAVAWEALA